jgi:hypothetical protein
MNEKFLKLELNTQLLYISLLEKRVAILHALKQMEVRIEVFEIAFKLKDGSE